jgi:hypothetical protein
MTFESPREPGQPVRPASDADSSAAAADDLSAALAALPRVDASPHFTRRVLLALDERMESKTATRTPLAAPFASRWSWATAAVLLVLVVGASGAWEQARHRRELRGELRALDAQRRALAADFERLDRGALLYLGSDDRTDYLVDVENRRVVSTATPVQGWVVPASQVY